MMKKIWLSLGKKVREWIGFNLLTIIFLTLLLITIYWWSIKKWGWATWGTLLIIANVVYGVCGKNQEKQIEKVQKEIDSQKNEKEKSRLKNKIADCNKFAEEFVSLYKYIEYRRTIPKGELKGKDIEEKKTKIVELLVRLPEINDYKREQSGYYEKKSVSKIICEIYYEIIESDDKVETVKICYTKIKDCYDDVIMATKKLKQELEREYENLQEIDNVKNEAVVFRTMALFDWKS